MEVDFYTVVENIYKLRFMNRIEVFHLEGALINNYFEETNVKLVFFSTFFEKKICSTVFKDKHCIS